MGYKSEVKICTTIEGFNKMKEFVDKTLNLTNTVNLLDYLDEKIENVEEDYIIFGWESAKWYEDCCDDVKAIMKSLDYINEMNIPYRYARIGSDSDDIELLYVDDEEYLPDFSVDVVLSYDIALSKETEEYYALFSCNEWKDYASMRLIGVFTRAELNKQIREKIQKGDMEFDDDNIYSDDNLSAYDINTLLKYGHVQELSINEVL